MWHTRNAHKCGSGGVVSADLIAIQLLLWISVLIYLTRCVSHIYLSLYGFCHSQSITN